MGAGRSRITGAQIIFRTSYIRFDLGSCGLVERGGGQPFASGGEYFRRAFALVRRRPGGNSSHEKGWRFGSRCRKRRRCKWLGEDGSPKADAFERCWSRRTYPRL